MSNRGRYGCGVDRPDGTGDAGSEGDRLRSRVPVGLLVQGAVLLPELPRQTARPLDALAGGAAARALVRCGVFEPDDADAMLAWPHSGFHVHDAVWVPDGHTAFALRLARYCAHNPVALERLTYEPDSPVRYRSDTLEGPTAGTETVDPLEFLARITAHIPDTHQVMTRYDGWYANRPRGRRRRFPRPRQAPPRPRCAADPDWNSYRRWCSSTRSRVGSTGSCGRRRRRRFPDLENIGNRRDVQGMNRRLLILVCGLPV